MAAGWLAQIVSVLAFGCAPPVDAAQPPAAPDPQAAIRRSADENAARRGDCRLYPEWQRSPYVLPWEPGRELLVTRTTEHYIRGNGGVGLYAIDVPMPIGTPVVAARGGRVVAVREEFLDGNGEDLKENFVFIRHEDGTIARYFHLTHEGALVSVGDRVRRGQRIALSGNTGDSAGPHLHFDVQTCGPNLPPHYNALPCGQTVPLTFRNTRPNPCGLIAGERYGPTIARPGNEFSADSAGRYGCQAYSSGDRLEVLRGECALPTTARKQLQPDGAVLARCARGPE